MKWLRSENAGAQRKSETALSDKSYNDATVRALFRLMERLKDSDHVVNMSVDNRMTSTGLYKVELTATYEQRKGAVRSNSLNDLKSKLDTALHRAKGANKDYRSYPAERAAKMYQDNDSVKKAS